MNGFISGLAAGSFLVGLLFFFSVVDSSIDRLSRLSLRVLAERESHPRLQLLRKMAADRTLFLLPLELGCQALLVVLAVLFASLFWNVGLTYAPLWAIVATMAVNALFRQLFPRMITQASPERVLLKVLPYFSPFYRLLSWLSWPLSVALQASKASNDKNQLPGAGGEEPSEEEIQAYLGVGEEEGIFEEEESELIQSALEFGDTLAREIMTPSTEIVAIEGSATVSQLRSLMVSKKFSRIPVYCERIDHISGLVYVRNLLGYLDDGRGEEPITPLINKAWFVPETKKVSELLKEMQRNAEQMAILINEYGSVSGLVTMEDMIEEIVGEIRDEDEQEEIDLVQEGHDTYIVRGSAEIEELEEALEVDLGEPDVTTVSGLVVGHLGRVPASGERVPLGGLMVQILKSDEKKIQSMRVKRMEEDLLPSPERQSERGEK